MMPMLSHSNSLMDEDPGIMSEAETSATGFRRGSKPRSSLPVVRTPSKTLERPLGLVFLQYRHETKRALLPNEITTLDTVRALFVRSFARQLSMEYFDSNNVRIYIHDSNQDMFYELEDLRDIRDRSILRLFETDELKQPINFQSALPISLSQLSFLDDGIADGDQPLDFLNSRLMPSSSPLSSATWDDLSYFSEPEFDSDYRPQNVHKAKNRGLKPSIGLSNGRQALSTSATVAHHGSVTSLAQTTIVPRNLQGRAALHRSYSITAEQTPSPPRIDRITASPVKHGRDYVNSVSCDQPSRWDEDGSEGITSFFTCSQQALPPQVPPRPPERSFHNYNNPPSAKPTFVAPSSSLTYGRPAVFVSNGFNDVRPTPPSLFQNNSSDPIVDEQTRKRMELVERQLASLTGLVQTALTGAVGVHVQQPPRADSNGPDATTGLALSSEEELGLVHHLAVKTPRLGKSSKDKCVSFEKSVSFCDDPVDLHEGKHSPQPTESKPAKPAIKSSTLPRASSQVSVYKGDSGWIGSMETYTQLRLLQKNARDLRSEMRSLRRLSQAQLSAVKEAVKDTIQIMKKTFLVNSDVITNALSDSEPSVIENSLRSIHRQEENYQKEMKQLERDLSELETSVENLRSHVINKKTRVSMADVEQLASLLSRSSKSVDLLKTQFPALEESIKGVLTYQMDRQAEDSRFLVEAPNKLENTIGRCKKLTSTLVTLRRLASVQEQRQPHAPEKPTLSKSAPSYSTSVANESSSANVIRSTTQQGNAWYEIAQQPDAFTSTLELQPANRAVIVDSGTTGTVTRNPSWLTDQCSDHTQRTESRSPNALDTLLDELKNYSETNKPGGDITVQSKSITVGHRAPPTPLESNLPSNSTVSASIAYAESSVDNVVGRRRAPPPPPPRTSSRSPLASPLRAQKSLHSRPLPNLPTSVEANHLAMSLAMKGPLSPQLILNPQRQRRNSSLSSVESKVPTEMQNPSAKADGLQDGLLRTASPTTLSGLVRRASHSASNSTVAVSDGVPPVSPKRDTLETRHQELLKTQKQLQERYDRLQKLHGPQLNAPATTSASDVQQSTSSAVFALVRPNKSAESKPVSETISSSSLSIDSEETAISNEFIKTEDPSNLSSDEQSVSSTTSSTRTEIECIKGRDHLFISLLLDNTHETDIL